MLYGFFKCDEKIISSNLVTFTLDEGALLNWMFFGGLLFILILKILLFLSEMSKSLLI